MPRKNDKPTHCPKCGKKLARIWVKVEHAKSKALSYQCGKCPWWYFDKPSSEQVLEEIRAHDLKIKQKLVKLSADRLGIYFNSHIIRSLNLKKGEDVYVSVPDKKHIVIELDD